MFVLPLPHTGIWKFSLAWPSLSPTTSSHEAIILVKWSQCHRFHILFYSRKNIPCCLRCLVCIRNSRKYVVNKGIYYQRNIVIFILLDTKKITHFIFIFIVATLSAFYHQFELHFVQVLPLEGASSASQALERESQSKPFKVQIVIHMPLPMLWMWMLQLNQILRALIFRGIILYCDKLTHTHFFQLRYLL